MKIVIINCFDTYEERVDLLCKFFVERNNEVTIIQSDFRHFKKNKRKDNKKNYVFLETKPYYKNLSYARLKSHYTFAKKAFLKTEEISPDIVYALLPPNSIAKFASKYKRKYRNVKLVFDLIDLWPETMPLDNFKSLPPFKYWAALRNANIKNADLIITECNLYRRTLEKHLKNVNSQTLYLAKKELNIVNEKTYVPNEIHLGYLGSINNIIDIPRIKEIVKTLNDKKPTILHIIGDGEKKEEFINELKEVSKAVNYYGKVYEMAEKQRIFSKCNFGINIMKESVCVGLTMKSIDYFQLGLPLLNNIKSDTEELVEMYNIGFNIDNNHLELITEKIIEVSNEDSMQMSRNAEDVFKKLFTEEAFNKKMSNIFEGII